MDSPFVEIGLFCVKREVEGVELTVVGRHVVEKYARRRKGRMVALGREISDKNRFPPAKSLFLEVPISGIFEALYILSAISRSIISDKI